nr:MAG TPA: hypothetical protein [Bacteriophage sp.]
MISLIFKRIMRTNFFIWLIYSQVKIVSLKFCNY